MSWLVGPRDAGSVYTFMNDVASRIRTRIQLTTDGHHVYLNAIEDAFGANVDYAMLTKVYGTAPEKETRYSLERRFLHGLIMDCRADVAKLDEQF